MSSTRYAQDGAALRQARYMSSPEFAELRGVSGVAVAARAAILDSAEKRKLVWFLQGLSLMPGGLKKVASDLLEMFPERLGTETMLKLRLRPGSIVRGKELCKIEAELRQFQNEEDRHDETNAILMRAFAETDYERQEQKESQRAVEKVCYEELMARCRSGVADHLERFLVDLCINPRLRINAEKNGEIAEPGYEARVQEQFPDVKYHEFLSASVPGFHRITDALLEYQRRHEEAARRDFQSTAVAEKIFETLDFALASRRMVLIDGLEGRGKTEAAKAWCERHLGEARFVSLKAVTSKTTAFREIAKALGVTASYARTATQIQARIEDVLQRSKLLVVIDEAHWLFNQSQRIYTRPELIDWLDTALCNQGVPAVLITTPQFVVCMKRAADQVGWNWRQFRRRVKRYVVLPDKNTTEDIERVARKLMPGANKQTIKLTVGYSMLSGRDLSGVGDVAEEAWLLAKAAGRSVVTYEDVNRAMKEFLLPSDTAFAQRLNAATAGRRKPGRKPFAPPLPTPGSDAAEESEPPEFPNRQVTPAVSAGRIPQSEIVAAT